MPDRPYPDSKKKTEGTKGIEGIEGTEETEGTEGQFISILKNAKKTEDNQDVSEEQEGEVEGDEILNEIGGKDYKERLERMLEYINDNSNEFLTREALQTYSPKFLNILENITDDTHLGLHLVYSQFRTAEGIGLFSLVLNKNGFSRFKITKKGTVWEIDMTEEEQGKPTYALYTGTETSEEKEIIRHIYNGEWDQIPDTISNELKKRNNNNNMGEIIKVLMITSSGSEGINLRNTRYVHIMEPYWHPVRLEQVIGRARRICSHKDLPIEFQTVNVFIYLMGFTPEQLKSNEAVELKRKDVSKGIGGTSRVPFTSDQFLFEISQIKSTLTAQLTDAIKESAFDCNIYSNGKCFNFGEVNNSAFSYVPDFSQQQNDTIVQANKTKIEWVGREITIGETKYVYREINPRLGYLYDFASYYAALINPIINPLQVGTLEKNAKGENVIKFI
jgi:hypothetical protein